MKRRSAQGGVEEAGREGCSEKSSPSPDEMIQSPTSRARLSSVHHHRSSNSLFNLQLVQGERGKEFESPIGDWGFGARFRVRAMVDFGILFSSFRSFAL